MVLPLTDKFGAVVPCIRDVDITDNVRRLIAKFSVTINTNDRIDD